MSAGWSMSDPGLLAKLVTRGAVAAEVRAKRIKEALGAGMTEFTSVSGTEVITIEPSPERPGEHRITRWGPRGLLVRVDSPDALAMLFEMCASKPAKPGMATKFKAAQVAAVEGQE